MERKLKSAHRGMGRIMLGVIWREKKGASWMREQTSVEDIITAIKKADLLSHDKVICSRNWVILLKDLKCKKKTAKLAAMQWCQERTG